MRHPIASVVAVGMLLGIWFVAFGLVRFVEAFSYIEQHRVWNLLVALVEVIAGIIIVSTPASASRRWRSSSASPWCYGASGS